MSRYKFFFINIWYNKKLHFIYYVLYYLFGFFLIELIFRYIIFFRKILYKYNILKKYKFNIPVIVVGNITIGGTGKTPLVIYIVNYLVTKGFSPAIVSRGYKSNIKNIQIVLKDSDPFICGDEPVLLAKSTNCPVVIGKDRVAAINYLLKNYDQIDVIICDDGLQHYRLARDLEIVVIDGSRWFGNGHLLPFGPLREPIARLKHIDLMIINNDKNSTEQNNQQYNNHKYIITLSPHTIYNLLEPNQLKTLEDFLINFPTVRAVSGIGNNQRFFDGLKNKGFNIIPHAFCDHYDYREQDLCFNDNLPIIMTEKDAVKCLKFAKNNFWSQTVIVEFNLPDQFNEFIINFLNRYKRYA